jgi:hypothetical protein
VKRGKHRRHVTSELPVLTEPQGEESGVKSNLEQVSDEMASARDEVIDVITLEQAKNMLAWFATKYPVTFDACTHEVL